MQLPPAPAHVGGGGEGQSLSLEKLHPIPQQSLPSRHPQSGSSATVQLGGQFPLQGGTVGTQAGGGPGGPTRICLIIAGIPRASKIIISPIMV